MDGVTCPKGCTGNICGMEVQGVYDGILYWICEVCRGAFQRFPKDHYLHHRAEYFIARSNSIHALDLAFTPPDRDDDGN